jgi:hypothetical protein
MALFQDIEIGDFNFVGKSFGIQRGVTNQFDIAYLETSGSPRNLTPFNAKLSLSKFNPRTKSYDEVLTLSTDDGTIVLTDGTETSLGTNIYLTFNGSAIQSLDKGTYKYSLLLYDNDPSGKYLLQGSAEVDAEITTLPQPTS